MTLVFLDTETTGLDPLRHEVWEVAYAVDGGPVLSGVVPHSLRNADPEALSMNGYLARGHGRWVSVENGLRGSLSGATLVGANPAFDAAFLRARWGVSPWHYRLLDVEAYAAGVLGLEMPQGLAKTTKTVRDLGFDIPEPDHTAAGDVATVRAVYEALREIQQAWQNRL